MCCWLPKEGHEFVWRGHHLEGEVEGAEVGEVGGGAGVAGAHLVPVEHL